jgi:predicted nucleic acid-binding protein
MVLIDTTIWSLALRRRAASLRGEEQIRVRAWAALVRSGRACLVGPVRQEILSGIRGEEQFRTIQARLGDFRYLEIVPNDYDRAARFFNVCRAHGIAGTPIDMLLCALADRCRVPIFTTDEDFPRYAQHLPIALYEAEKGEGDEPVGAGR